MRTAIALLTSLVIGCSTPQTVSPSARTTEADTTVPADRLSRVVEPDDVLVITGQSNALAIQQPAFVQPISGDANVDQDPRITTFGLNLPLNAGWQAALQEYPAEGNGMNAAGNVGQFGLHLGRLLLAWRQIPVRILNGAMGGQPISYFARNDANHADTATNYGLLLTRAQKWDVVGKVRSLVWFQGESDGMHATTGKEYHDAFAALRAAWHEDFPDLKRVYVVQVRPGCMGYIERIDLLDAQRRFQDEWPDVQVVSSLGLRGNGPDGCHYARVGYWDLAEAVAPLLERDAYGATGLQSIDAPNVGRVEWGSADHTKIVIHTRNAREAMRADVDAAKYFFANGTMNASAVDADGDTIGVTFPASVDTPSGSPTIAYLGHPYDGPQVLNARGLSLLAFQTSVPDAGCALDAKFRCAR